MYFLIYFHLHVKLDTISGKTALKLPKPKLYDPKTFWATDCHVPEIEIPAQDFRKVCFTLVLLFYFSFGCFTGPFVST